MKRVHYHLLGYLNTEANSNHMILGKKNLTAFTLGHKIPVYNPWLYCSEKLKKKQSIGKILILKNIPTNNTWWLDMYLQTDNDEEELPFLTLKLSIWEVLPALLTLSFAHDKISVSVISLPWERDLKFFKSCSMLNLINCHKKAAIKVHKLCYFRILIITFII